MQRTAEPKDLYPGKRFYYIVTSGSSGQAVILSGTEWSRRIPIPVRDPSTEPAGEFRRVAAPLRMTVLGKPNDCVNSNEK